LFFDIFKFKQNVVTYNNGFIKSWNFINNMSNIVKNFKWKMKDFMNVQKEENMEDSLEQKEGE